MKRLLAIVLACLLPASSAFAAAPAWRDHSDFNNDAGTSSTLLASGVSGLADGDLMIAMLYKENEESFTATPTGWTFLTSWSQTTGLYRYTAYVYWKIADGEGINSYTWSWTTSVWRSAVLVAYSCTTGFPADPIPTFSTDIETAQNDEPSHPGITVARSNSAVVMATWNYDNTNSDASPTGYTNRYDNLASVGGAEIAVYDDLTTTTGATGTLTAGYVNPEYPSSLVFEIASEAGGAVVTPRRRSGIGIQRR